MWSNKGRFPWVSGRGIFSALLFGASAVVTLPGDGTHAAVNPFFTRQQTSSNDISAFTKWTSVLPRYEAQHQTAEDECYGEGCLNKQWEVLLEELRSKPMKEQLEAINDFFNAIPYVSDEDNYGTADYWATPYQMMENGGDCEDFAIAKYISLRRLGVPEQDMRLLIVRDHDRGDVIHAVLEVTLPDGSHILDNQEDRVLAADRVTNYDPVFAINEAHWWSFR